MSKNDNVDNIVSDAPAGDLIDTESPVAILKRAPDPADEKPAPRKPVAPYAPRSASTTQLKKVAGEIGAALKVLKDTSSQNAKDVAAEAPEDDLFAAAAQAQAEAEAEAPAPQEEVTGECVVSAEEPASTVDEEAEDKPAAKLKLIAPPKAPAKKTPPKPKVQPYKPPVEQQAVETAKIVATAVVNKLKFSASKSMAVSEEDAVEAEEPVAAVDSPLKDSVVLKKVKLSTTKAPAVTDADLAAAKEPQQAEAAVAKKVKLSTTKAPAVTDADLAEKPKETEKPAAVALEKPKPEVAVAKKVKLSTTQVPAVKEAAPAAEVEEPAVEASAAAKSKESEQPKKVEKKKALKPVRPAAPDLKLTAEPVVAAEPSMAPRPSLEPSVVMPALETGGGGRKRPSAKWVATFVIAATTCIMVIYTVVGGAGEFSDVKAVVPTPVVADVAPDTLHQFVVPETLPQSELDVPRGN
jgi:hypothetical protein